EVRVALPEHAVVGGAERRARPRRRLRRRVADLELQVEPLHAPNLLRAPTGGGFEGRARRAGGGATGTTRAPATGARPPSFGRARRRGGSRRAGPPCGSSARARSSAAARCPARRRGSGSR